MYVDFRPKKVGGKHGPRRGPIYRVHHVQTAAKPYIYKLQNISNNKLLPGRFYGAELLLAVVPDNLKIEQVIKRKKSPEGKNLIYVKFQGHSDAFNHWIEN